MISGLEDSVEVHQVDGGYAGLVRLDSDTVNLCFTVERPLARQRVSFEALLEGFLEVNPTLRALLRGGQPCSELRSISPVYFPPRKRYGDGFLLVGDAAQVTEPVSGEGIYFALRGGQLAARAASVALRANETAARRLEPYESICNAEFAARVRLNRGLRVIMRHPALLAALIPLLRRQALLDALLRRICGANTTAPAAAAS